MPSHTTWKVGVAQCTSGNAWGNPYLTTPTLPHLDGCLLYVGTLYDLFQLLSLVSILCMVLFVRSQFNRVEQVGLVRGCGYHRCRVRLTPSMQECCHAMVFEVERLLQVGDGSTDDSLSTPHTIVVSVSSAPR